MISVIVPSFNSATFISEMLVSLEGQLFKDFEVLICDAGSQDQTLDIVEFYSKKMNIKIVSRSDTGVPDALNKGFFAAKGEIVCWLNTDDLYCSNETLLLVNDFFKRNTEIEYCIGKSSTIDKQGYVTKILHPWIPKNSKKQYTGGNNIFTGSLFFKKNSIKDFKFNEKYSIAFEYELLKYLMCMKKGKILQSSNSLAAFRVYPGTLSSANKDKIKSQMKEIFFSEEQKKAISKRQEIFYRIFFYIQNQNFRFFLDVFVDKIRVFGKLKNEL